ncbi:ribosylnicotinamide kinase [Coemansia sp. RSA 518]|nr:ribosylnicotinamide kinase [Coemansia sp. RSA 518]
MDKMVQTIQSTRKQLEDLPGCGKSVEVHSSFASQWANPQKDVNSKLPPKALDSLRNTVLHRLNVESTEEIPFSLILVDGILLFYDEANNESPGAECDTGLFIYAQYETLKQRREARSAYVTKDGIWEDPPGYFDSIVWPNFVKYHSNLIAAHPEITDRKVTSAGGQKSAHEANVAICSSDMPFKDTLDVCVESILGEWNRRQQIQAQR